MVFDEYIGYTFVYIATEEIELMRRAVGICVSIVRHVCGPDIVMLVFTEYINKYPKVYKYIKRRDRIVETYTHTYILIHSFSVYMCVCV